MAKTVGRMKNGNLMLTGEATERVYPVTNGLTSFFPLDGNLNDELINFKRNGIISKSRDWYGTVFPTRYDYKGMTFRITGRVRCTQAVDWNAYSAGVGFRYQTNAEGAATSYTWPLGWSKKLNDIREWTYFSFEQTIGSNFTSNLLPFIQNSMPGGTAGYQIEVEDLNYTLVTELSTTSNVTIVDTGVRVEEATTNMLAGKDMTISATGGEDSTGKYFIKNSTDAWYLGIGVPSTNVVAGADYTFSMEIMCDRPFNVRFDPNVSASNKTGNDNLTVIDSTATYSTPGKWQRVYLSVTTASDAASDVYIHHSFCPSDPNVYGRKVYYRNIQLENKKFYTSYTPISRGEGSFKLTNVLSQSRGSVVVEVTFFEDDTINGVNGSDQYCFGNQGTWNAANTWQFHDTDYWYIRDQDNVQHQVFMGSPIVRNERTHLVFVYDDSDGTMDIYKNGVLTSNGAKKTAMLGKLSLIGTNWTHSGTGGGTSYKMCQEVHQLAFFNRPLTAAEVSKIYKRSFGITKEGNLQTDIVEGPLRPADSFYFPLTENGEDISHSIKPIADTNTYYSSEGVHLDNGTINRVKNMRGWQGARPVTNGWDQNLHSDALAVDYWGTGYNDGVVDPGIGYHAKWVAEGMFGNPCIKFMDINSKFNYTVSGNPMTHRWLGIRQEIGTPSANGWAVGDKLTISWIQKCDTTGKGADVGIYYKSVASGSYGFSGARQAIYVNKANTWERVSFTCTITSDWDLTSVVSVYVYGTSGNEGILWVDGVQVEKSDFMKGLANGTSSYSRLTYTASSVFPDFSSFTILYWAKFFQTGGYQLMGAWPKFYFGQSSTGKVIFSWRENSVNTGNVDSQRNITAATTIPLNKWQMLGVTVTEGARIDLYLNGKADGSFTSPFLLTGTQANFGLNSYDASNTAYPQNAILRDLIIVPKVLSANEIESIYKTHVRAYKNSSIRTQGIIQEGQVL